MQAFLEQNRGHLKQVCTVLLRGEEPGIEAPIDRREIEAPPEIEREEPLTD